MRVCVRVCVWGRGEGGWGKRASGLRGWKQRRRAGLRRPGQKGCTARQTAGTAEARRPGQWEPYDRSGPLFPAGVGEGVAIGCTTCSRRVRGDAAPTDSSHRNHCGTADRSRGGPPLHWPDRRRAVSMLATLRCNRCNRLQRAAVCCSGRHFVATAATGCGLVYSNGRRWPRWQAV